MKSTVSQFVQYMLNGRKLPKGASYLYGLVDPITDEIRYIGITRHPFIRLKQHIRSGRFKVGAWIRKLYREHSKRPIPVLLAICDTHSSGDIEKIAIKRLREFGSRLTNLTDGGLGVSQKGRIFTDDHKYRLSTAAKMRTYTQSECQANSLRAKKAWDNPEYRAKMMQKRRDPAIQRQRVETRRNSGWIKDKEQ